MNQVSTSIFDSTDFMPHGHCYLWRKDLLFLHVISDSFIGLAYFLIPIAIIYFVVRKRDLKVDAVPILFSLFIISCGITHIFDIVTIWKPFYFIQGILKAITALVSMVTAIVLFRIVPNALKIPTSQELYKALRARKNSLQRVRTLTQEISARDQIEIELSRAKEIAENATRSKSQFLASMSHEIRTPLGIMLSLSEQISKDQTLSAKHQELLSTIQRNGNFLSRVINDILDLSKIEAGKLELELAEINVQAFLQDMADTFKFRAAEKGLLYEVIGGSELPSAFFSDDLRLKQILINLLNNAFKNTAKGTISLRMDFDKFRRVYIFEVEDTGQGIPLADQGKVFESFEQAASTQGGTGLGLALVKRFAALFNGNISLVRSEINKGTLFRLEVPELDSADIAEDVPSTEVLDENLRAPNLAGQNLLVVDDNQDNLLVLELLLKDTYASVTLVMSGAEAIHEAQQTKFDLVLLDLQMPEMDGFATLEQLRLGGFTGPVGAVSAYALKEDIKKSRNAGFLFHISKPIQTKFLFKKLAEFATPSSDKRLV